MQTKYRCPDTVQTYKSLRRLSSTTTLPLDPSITTESSDLPDFA